MNVVKIMGGLGNQLFQYALGKHLEQFDAVGYDVSYYDSDINKNGDVPHRDFVLPHFVDRLVFAGQEDRERINQWEYDRGLAYTDKYFWGDWQKVHFFEGADLNIRFKPRLNKKAAILLDYIRNTNSVSVHVRRTDYIGLGWALSAGYYEKAISEMRKIAGDIDIFVFSDDLEWCHKNVCADMYCRFDELTDFYLMSRCKHNIIANSTFSFWAAYLNENQDKTVIYPENWICTSNPCEGLPWKGV